MERRKEGRNEAEREVWLRRVKGWTQQRIADDLGIPQPTVCAMLKRIESKLALEFKERAAEIKAQQTAVHERIAQEALLQWERSCQDAERISTVTGRARATELGVIELPDQETRTVEGQSGNPALLEKAMAAYAVIRTIWGLDAPTKSEGTLTHEAKVYLIDDNSGDWPTDV